MIIDTQFGPFYMGVVQGELVCDFKSDSGMAPPPKKWVDLLVQYFDGKEVDFSQAPLPKGSPFFQKCWIACRAIPYGQTISYGELASAAGSPRAARAAGQAMKQNPMPVITPCHRVIASSGKLHGFAGNIHPTSREVRIKRSLLSLEQSCIRACIMHL